MSKPVEGESGSSPGPAGSDQLCSCIVALAPPG
jgi:hypothetical protein